jgi:DNA-binding MarR family transcriptional regulator
MNADFWERLARAKTHALQLRVLQAIQESDEPLSPNRLSEQLGEPLGNVSYHVGRLKNVGLLELTHTEPRRGAVEHFYREAVSA